MLVLNGINYEEVMTHPGRKTRSMTRLPKTIWIQDQAMSSIFDVAQSLGYRYVSIGEVTRRVEGKLVKYKKYRLITTNKISGLRRPWEYF